MNVVLLSHSLFVPYLLIVFQTALNASREIDAQQLETSLQSVARSLDSLQEELQGRFARAITMLTNSRDQLSDVVSRARRAVTSLRVDTTAAAPSIESPTGEYVPGVSRDDDA
jgi:DNA recombination protein RmuC